MRMTEAQARIARSVAPFLPEGEAVIEGIVAFAHGIYESDGQVSVGRNVRASRLIVGTERTLYLFRTRWYRILVAKEKLATWPFGHVPFGVYAADVRTPRGGRLAVIEIGDFRLAASTPYRPTLAALLARHDAAVKDAS